MWRGVQIFTGVDELFSFGQLSTNTVEGAMDPESHSLHYEIVLMRSGTRNMDLLSRGSVQIAGGEALVIPPGEMHGDSTFQTRFSMDYIIFSNPRRADVYHYLTAEEKNELATMLESLPQTPFRLSKKAVDLFDELFRIVSDFELPLRPPRIRSVLLLLLYEVINSARQMKKERPASDIMDAVQYIADHPGIIPTVDELAQAVHLSESRFKQKFKQEMGIPPKEYILREKVNQAKLLLTETDLTVSEIAQRVGFSSGQHMSVQFRQRTDMTPLQYRHHTEEHTGG